MTYLLTRRWSWLAAVSALALAVLPASKLYQHRDDACRGAMFDPQFVRALGLSAEQAEVFEEAGGSIEKLCGLDDDRRALMRHSIEVENESAAGSAKEFLLRNGDDNGMFDPAAYQAALSQRRALLQKIAVQRKPAAAGATPQQWKALGPTNIPGRIASLAVDPADANHLLLGAWEAGLWTSTDEGRTWVSSAALPSVPISAIVFGRTPGLVYALATSPIGYSSSNIPASAVYKSVDAGATWIPLTATRTASTPDPVLRFLSANALAVSPTDDNLLIVTLNCAIQRSADGGQTWVAVYSDCGPPTAATPRMVPAYPRFDPNNSAHVVVGTTGGVVSSQDGGLTWSKVLIAGLASTSYANPVFAASMSGMLYAASYPAGASPGVPGLLFKSTDGGASWQQVNTFEFSYGVYTNQIWVDPGNPNLIVVGGIFLSRSTDGGASFTRINGAFIDITNTLAKPAAATSPHGDQHAIVSPANYDTKSNRKVFVANDGGVMMAPDITTVTPNTGWIQRSGLLTTAQYYGIGSSADGGLILAGAQDTGLHAYSGDTTWITPLDYTDFTRIQIDQDDRTFAYAGILYLGLYRSNDGGTNWKYITGNLTDAGNFNAPFILDPSNQRRLYAGGRSLWVAPDATADVPAWTSIKAPSAVAENYISAIAVSRADPNIIWVGHNNGELYRTANGRSGAPTWTKVTSSKPTRQVGSILIDVANPQRVFIGYNGFADGNLIVTGDSGATWSTVGGGFPPLGIRKIVQDPMAPNTLYTGTAAGVYWTTNGGESWVTSTDGPNDADVFDIALIPGTGGLLATTYSRGAFLLSGAVTAVPVSDPPVRVGAVFSTAQSNARSFLRFYNAGVSAGTASVTLSDSTTGQPVAQWTSPAIAAGTSVQYAIDEPESMLTAAKPQYYSVSVQAQFPGHFQHVLWRPSDGTLTNLSTCNTGVSANPVRLTHVHSSRLGNVGYPSSIVIHNTSDTRQVELVISDARTGVELGTYATPIIPVYGELIVPISEIEAGAHITPLPSQLHYTISVKSPPDGYLQHLVDNQKASVVSDMTTVCALGLIGRATDPNNLTRLGAVFSTAQGSSQSYLRFTNTGTAAGLAVIRLYDPVTGRQIGTSAPGNLIAPGASQQVGMVEVERQLQASPGVTAKPKYYSVVIYAQFSGTFQHILYHPADGTLTNLTTCDSGVTADPRRLAQVHSSLIGDQGFPSSIVVFNTAASAQPATLVITDALDGNPIGSYPIASIPANGQSIVLVSAIEAALKFTPNAIQFHYNVAVQAPFTGFLQHLVNNQKAGVISDMTTVCTMPLSGP